MSVWSPRPDDLSGTPSLNASLERVRDVAHRNGSAAGIEAAELFVAVLRHPWTDTVDPGLTLEVERGSSHEPFNAAVSDGEAGRFGNWIVEDVAGHERVKEPPSEINGCPRSTRRICPRSLL